MATQAAPTAGRIAIGPPAGALAAEESAEPGLNTPAGSPDYAEMTEAFREVAEAINEEIALDDLLHMVAERICKLLHIQRCSVYLREGDSGLFRGQVAETGSQDDAAIKRLTAGIEADGFTQEILTRMEPVLITNAQRDPRPVRSTMLEWGVLAMLGVPMVLEGEVIGILFLDNCDIPHEYTGAEQQLAAAFANLAATAISQAQTTSELRSSLRTVARQNSVLRKAAAIEERLTELVLEGASLDAVASAVADLTGMPCAIYNAEYRRLAGSRPPEDDVPLPKIFDQAMLGKPAVATALEGLQPKQPTVIGPLRAARLHQRHLIAPVTVYEEHWGYLVFMEHKRRFGSLDLTIARRAATIIALELTSESRAAEADLHARGALVRDLVRNTDNRDSLLRRADFHGLRSSEPHFVCLFRRRDPTNSRPPAARKIVQSLVTGEDGGYVTHVQEGVIAILEAPDGDPREALEWARNRARAAATSVAGDGDIIVGISAPCTAIEDYPRAYGEAVRIAETSTAFTEDQSSVQVLAAADLGVVRVLLSADNHDEIEAFAGDTLGPLAEPEHHELLETLRAFLGNDCRVRASAGALDVHENTIRYRLSRIEELTGLAIATSSPAQLSCQLALTVLDLRRGQRPEPGAGTPAPDEAPSDADA